MNKQTIFHQHILPLMQEYQFETFAIMVILLMAFCYTLEKWG